MKNKYDCSGWATKNDILCSDGRTIRRDAFKECDGLTVPVVYQHRRDNPTNILGHALLENRPEGVYCYISFNDTKQGQHAREMVRHGDITSLSIYANKLKQLGGDVLHGVIREVSLVLAGANIGAHIDCPELSHGEDSEFEATIYTGEEISLTHSDEEEKETMADKPEKKTNDKIVGDVFETLTEEQKTAVYFIIGQVLEDAKKDGGKEEDAAKHSEQEDNTMHYNAFENGAQTQTNILSHSDQEMIIAAAKKYGSFQQAFEAFAEENDLKHDALPGASGFTSYPSGNTPAGVDALFPEWYDMRTGAPELVTEDLTWVDVVLKKTHKTPYSRIRTGQVDIRNIDDLRAKGYEKGGEKGIVGNYELVRRTTDPQTIYVKSALNRDDVVDIKDFDYVAYQYGIDRRQLEEELATAILLGDGRTAGTDGKIDETHIRPVWTDDDLYTIHQDLTPFMAAINGDFSDNFGDNYKYSEAMVAAMLDAMVHYRGSGSLDMFCTQQFVNKMLLARDLNGRRLYANKSELATAIGVNNIYPVSKMANKTRTKGTGQNAKTMQLDAICLNLGDYNVGSTKGGEITHFTDFDIDFNQLKSLIEARVSGANTRIYSAIVLEEDVTPAPSNPG